MNKKNLRPQVAELEEIDEETLYQMSGGTGRRRTSAAVMAKSGIVFSRIDQDSAL